VVKELVENSLDAGATSIGMKPQRNGSLTVFRGAVQKQRS
jgi:DNA mismatch repair ATPase MutL